MNDSKTRRLKIKKTLANAGSGNMAQTSAVGFNGDVVQGGELVLNDDPSWMNSVRPQLLQGGLPLAAAQRTRARPLQLKPSPTNAMSMTTMTDMVNHYLMAQSQANFTSTAQTLVPPSEPKLLTKELAESRLLRRQQQQRELHENRRYKKSNKKRINSNSQSPHSDGTQPIWQQHKFLAHENTNSQYLIDSSINPSAPNLSPVNSNLNKDLGTGILNGQPVPFEP